MYFKKIHKYLRFTKDFSIFYLRVNVRLIADSFSLMYCLLKDISLENIPSENLPLIFREVQYIVLQNIATMSIQRKVCTL